MLWIPVFAANWRESYHRSAKNTESWLLKVIRHVNADVRRSNQKIIYVNAMHMKQPERKRAITKDATLRGFTGKKRGKSDRHLINILVSNFNRSFAATVEKSHFSALPLISVKHFPCALSLFYWFNFTRKHGSTRPPHNNTKCKNTEMSN